MNSRDNLKTRWYTIIMVALPVFMFSCKNNLRNKQVSNSENVVQLGVLFSLTGDRSITETSMRDAAAMAVEEINNDGGILGKQVEMLALDAESNDNIYKGIIIQLINKYRVSAVLCNLPLGAREFASNRLTKSKSLLFDLKDYTKTSKSPTDIVKLGSSPNQLLLPGVQYLLNLPNQPYSKFYIIGTDELYSKSVNNLIRAYLISQGVPAKNIKERNVSYTLENFSKVIVDVKRFSTDGKACVLNTIWGKTNVPFFKEFANQGLSSIGCPILSFAISEDELREIDAEFIIGNLFCRNYFQSVDTDKNIRFVSDFKLFCAIQELPGGIDRVTGEAICRAYTAVYLWKKAVEKAGSFEKEKIKQALAGLEFNSPAGMIKVNEQNLSLDKPVMIGESNAEGQIDVIWHSNKLIPALGPGQPDTGKKEDLLVQAQTEKSL